MTLYMIGIGLWDQKDITAKGLEAVRLCDYVYLEDYTSKLNCTKEDLEEFYGKKIKPADRDLVEQRAHEILDKAKEHEVAFLVIGDVFAATTHTDIRLRAFKKGIQVKVIHNASVLTAVGDTGLELYKFGKVTSIPFENENVVSPLKVLSDNLEFGLHTLFLLDLKVDEDMFMTAAQAAEYILKNDISDKYAVACAGLGSLEPEIVYARLSVLKDHTLKKSPQCLVIPGKLHFMEEESLSCYKA